MYSLSGLEGASVAVTSSSVLMSVILPSHVWPWSSQNQGAKFWKMSRFFMILHLFVLYVHHVCNSCQCLCKILMCVHTVHIILLNSSAEWKNEYPYWYGHTMHMYMTIGHLKMNDGTLKWIKRMQATFDNRIITYGTGMIETTGRHYYLVWIQGGHRGLLSTRNPSKSCTTSSSLEGPFSY